jgi:hypothetical protein
LPKATAKTADDELSPSITPELIRNINEDSKQETKIRLKTFKLSAQQLDQLATRFRESAVPEISHQSFQAKAPHHHGEASYPCESDLVCL